ncbi:MAG: class I SAM-dependent methyltransferase [Solirubrobacterales bacterium]
MDYERLYEYRFRDVDQRTREAVWRPIAAFVHDQLGRPARVLDPAAGRCEFINAVAAEERWAVDRMSFPEGVARPGTRMVVGDVMQVELPDSHFDGVFVSNFLEHLPSADAVAGFLARMRDAMEPGARIAVMGPNYRHCAREYWDCADHTLALTDVAIEEHLYAAGLPPRRSIPRFLPYSFRGRLPASERLTRAYLGAPPLWRVLGKQFLVIAER